MKTFAGKFSVFFLVFSLVIDPRWTLKDFEKTSSELLRTWSGAIPFRVFLNNCFAGNHVMMLTMKIVGLGTLHGKHFIHYRDRPEELDRW